MSNTGSGLDLATITDLLKTEKKLDTSSKSAVTTLARPIQIGPLRYLEKDERCSSRGCGSSCRIRVKGIPYCANHALYEMNRMLLDVEDFDYSDCTCKAGTHSKMNVHTDDCPIWSRVKEQRDSNTSESATA